MKDLSFNAAVYLKKIVLRDLRRCEKEALKGLGPNESLEDHRNDPYAQGLWDWRVEYLKEALGEINEAPLYLERDDRREGK